MFQKALERAAILKETIVSSCVASWQGWHNG